MINFTGKKNWFFVASVIPMIIGVVFMIINGIPWGIDFTSGTTMTVEPVNQATLTTKLKDLGHSEAVIQDSGGTQFIIKTDTLGEDLGNIQKSLEGMGLTVASTESVSDGTVMTVALSSREALTRGALETKLADLGYPEATIKESLGENKFFVDTEELKPEGQSNVKAAFGEAGWTPSNIEYTSGEWAREKRNNTIIGSAIASVAMLIYIWWAFRKVSNPIRYGTCAVIAMLHDVFICVAFYVVFASSLNLEINLYFITGLLTVIGYSVNDTVVVFDRIRENLGKRTRNMQFEDVVNSSLTETLSRCLITVLTTLLAALAVWLFVGDPIRNLLMVLLVGVASGAYSSIFIASMLLVVWEKGRMKKLSANESAAQKAR